MLGFHNIVQIISCAATLNIALGVVQSRWFKDCSF